MTPQQAKKSVPINLATVPVNVTDVPVNPTNVPINLTNVPINLTNVPIEEQDQDLLTPGVVQQREERDRMVSWEQSEAERMAKEVVNGARPRWQVEGPMPYNELHGEVRVLQLLNPKENGLNYVYNPRALPIQTTTSTLSLYGRSTLDPFDAARPSQSKRAKKKRQRELI
jgi:hypothetical protein